ncbi:MAG: tyrosine-type recombinase/integrase, partial [Nitrospiraceae bacterium]
MAYLWIRAGHVERAASPPGIHPDHDHGHSMATFLKNQGVPLDVVQLLRGHTDPRTTQLYARLSLGAAKKLQAAGFTFIREPHDF